MADSEGKSKVLALSEFEHLIEITKKSHHAKRNLAMVHFSYGLGLRAKEIASLKIQDVTDGQKIFEEINLKKHMTKGQKQRTIYLVNRSVRDALIDYINHRKHQTAPPFHLHSALFLSQKGSEFTPNTLQKCLATLYKSAKITGASSHSGRRTFATRLLESGADIKAVSTLMGHASIQQTAKYAEDNPVRLKTIIASVY